MTRLPTQPMLPLRCRSCPSGGNPPRLSLPRELVCAMFFLPALGATEGVRPRAGESYG